ncbi:hypothetical protein Tco_0645532 [Tanacetum coccineum]
MGMILYPSPQIHKVKSRFCLQNVEDISREREEKFRTICLWLLPEDHLVLIFYKMTDAKEMWDAIKSRFGGNDESKKMQKYILKQQFEVSLIMRTKPGVDSLSFDDLYNNLRVFENDVKGSTASSSSTQNVAFVSENGNSTIDVSTTYSVSNTSGQNSQLMNLNLEEMDHFEMQVPPCPFFENDVKGSTASSSSTQNVVLVSENTSSTNDVSTAYGVSNSSGHNSQYEHTSSYSLHANQSSCPQLDHEDLEQLDEFDLEEMDLKWQNSRNKDRRRSGKQEDSKALVTIDGEDVDWTSHSEEEGDYALMACNSSGSNRAEGMPAVPPPMTGNYMPSGPDIEIDVETSEFVTKTVVNEPKVVSQPKVWSDAPIIEEYESDSEDEHVSLPTEEQETPSFANQQVKTPRETVKNQFTHSKNPKVDKKGLGYGFTTKACFVCGSFSHLIRDCDFHEKRMAKQV